MNVPPHVRDTIKYAMFLASLDRQGSAEVRAKPGDGAADTDTLLLGVDEVMAFVFVDNQPGFGAESFEGVFCFPVLAITVCPAFLTLCAGVEYTIRFKRSQRKG